MAYKNEEFELLLYFAHDGAGNGASLQDALPMVDASLAGKLEAGMVVSSAEVVVLEAITGTTDVLVGNSGDPDAYVASGDVTLGSVGLNVGAGAEVPSYVSADDSLELDFTGAASAGSMVLVLRGYKV